MSTKLTPQPSASARGAVKMDMACRDRAKPWPDRCNAHYKDGNYCHRRPLKNRKRCARHGARQGTGPENSNWRGGRSGNWLRRHLPAAMLQKFDTIVNDPDLISLRSVMALNGVRLGELMDKLPTGESRGVIAQLSGVLMDVHNQLTSLSASPGLSDKDKLTLDKALTSVSTGDTLCATAAQTSRVWDEMATVMESHRKLAETERRREEVLQQSITMQQAIAMFSGLYELISKVVRSEDERLALAEGLRKMLQAPADAEIVQ